MASNPIQKRARQSFLIGFLMALLIMAVVVVLLFMKINSLKEAQKALAVVPQTVYTTVDDIKSGGVVTPDMLIETTISVKAGEEAPLASYVTPTSFEYDEKGEIFKYYSKADIPAGSMISPDMIYKEGDNSANDERKVEYNMIVLPSQLKNGDYIDIRFRLSDGRDYIVLSKKLVQQTTAKSVWINMSELDILTINSAIVESYLLTGSKLYATTYTDPGMQEAATPTYAVNNDVLTTINHDANILKTAREELTKRWNSDLDQSDGTTDYRSERNHINGYVNSIEGEQKKELVEEGTSNEITDMGALRDEYVTQLEGTGLIGSTE